MSNLLISSENLIDDATAITADSEVSTLPIENVQDRQLVKVYRSNAATTVQIDVNFGSSKIVDFAAVIRHNLSQSATIRFRFSNVSDFSTTEYDSGVVDAWPVVEQFGTLPWGVFEWGGKLSVEDSVNYTISTYDILDDAVAAQYLRIDIVDSSNSDGYIQIGRIISGPAYRPSTNYGFGSEFRFADDSRVVKSRGGQTFIDEVERYRVAQFELLNIPEAEIFSNVFNRIDRLRGIAKDILIIPQPDKPETFISQNIYGRLVSTSPIQNRVMGYYGREFEVEELI